MYSIRTGFQNGKENKKEREKEDSKFPSVNDDFRLIASREDGHLVSLSKLFHGLALRLENVFSTLICFQ